MAGHDVLRRLHFELDSAASERNNRAKANPSLRGLQMRNALALMTVAALTAIALALPQSARAQERWPDIPPEVGGLPLGDRAAWMPWRCSGGPVYNVYHGAWYRVPPAVDRGFAYRPFYRYTAWRVVPTRYFCTAR
jgi:hypothetical protein